MSVLSMIIAALAVGASALPASTAFVPPSARAGAQSLLDLSMQVISRSHIVSKNQESKSQPIPLFKNNGIGC